MEILNDKSSGNNDDESKYLNYSSMVHSKKIVKHALRQQVKRRRKNTTIAAGNPRSVPRIIHALPTTDLSLTVLNDQQSHIVVEETAVTMKEVLASLPGFSIKSSRRRSAKKLSVAAQLEAGLVDLESPASILTNTSLRSLLNRHTFQGLPPLYQRKLAQLLPAVDRQDAAVSGLNNEFFAKACQEWRKRLAEGEFTPENQQKIKMEAEKDKNKLDPWKLKHFEPIWGEKREIHKLKFGLHCMNKEQKYSNAVTRLSSKPHVESNLKSVSVNRQPFDNSTLIDKDEDNVSSITTNKLQETDLNLVEKHRIIPEFDVTVQILEDEDYENEDDDEDDDDDDDEHDNDDNDDDVDDDDDEDDEDEDEDDEEDDGEEDEEEDDGMDSQVSLAYLQGETQHCRAIIVANSNDDELYNQRKMSSEMPIIETRKFSKEIILDLINDKKFLDVDRKVNEQKYDLRRHNIERSLKTSLKEYKYLNTDPVEILKRKSNEHPQTMHEEELLKLSENHSTLPVTSVYPNSVSKLKLIVKDECYSNDMLMNIKVPDKETPSFNTGLCCQENAQVSSSDNTSSTEITEVIELDNETLQRIHELEVQGEMQKAYDEISGCDEEIIYPILDDIEINSNDTKNSLISDTKNREIDSNIINRTEEEAFQEAHNYVCSEMLDCRWTANMNENINQNDNEELQVSWPIVTTNLDTPMPTNINITNMNNSGDSESYPNQKTSQHDRMSTSIDSSFSCIQLPVTPFSSDSLRIAAPVTSCLMKNIHTTQSSSVITFPQLQSIRFVQTNFQTTIEHSSSDSISNTASLCAHIQSSTSITQQSHNNLNSTQDTVVCRNYKDVTHQEFQTNNEFHNRSQHTSNAIQKNMQSQSTVVLKQQTLLPFSSRQIISMQPQQQTHYPMMLNLPCKVNRNPGIAAHRRSGNKDQNGNRSRNLTKEPPGAVNFERSYQICQAVIASSPNRDQLKAHLKPPPSLLTKTENSQFNTKFSSRASNVNRIQKNFHLTANKSITSNKSEGIAVKQVFSKSRQECHEETSDNQTKCENSADINQYMYLKKSEINDNAPRASSAPPIPPRISLPKVGAQIVHCRPASAGEHTYQAIALKSKRNNRGGKPEPSDIIAGDNPPVCECNMKGAMVICRKCGAFCHDDCISSQYVCKICLEQ